MWNVETLICEKVLKEHTDRVNGVVFAPDGDRLVTASSDKTARIWSVTGGRREHILTGHMKEVYCVAWSPDAKLLATGGADRSIRLYRSDGTFDRSVEGRENTVTSVRFTGNSKELLFTWGGAEAAAAGAALLAISSNGERARFANHDNVVLASALSPDGLLAASAGGRSHEVYLWNTTDGALRSPLVGRGRPNNSIGWSPDDWTIAWRDTPDDAANHAVGRLERTFRLASLKLGKAVENGYATDRHSLGSVSLISSGSSALDVKRGRASVKFQLRDPLDRVRCFTLLRGGEDRAIVGTEQGSLFLVDTRSGQEIERPFESHGDAVLAVAALEKGMFVTASSDQTIRIWDPERNQPLLSLFVAGDEWIAWTPEGYYAASAGGERLMGWQIDDKAEEVCKVLKGTDRHKDFHRPDVIKLLMETGSLAGALDIIDPARNGQTLGSIADRPKVRNQLTRANLPRLFVLAIGVSEYSVKSIRLQFADKDAEELEKVFKGEPGQGAFSDVQFRSLLNEQATARNIFDNLKWLKDQMNKEDDVGIIFYSGHGDRDSDGIFYMLPVGVDPNRLDETAVSGDVFKKKVGGIKKNLVVMLDACHTGQIAKGTGGNKQFRPRAEDFARDAAQEPGVVMMCSSTGNEVSIEDINLKHGYFTQALTEGLSSRADLNGDGYVNLKELDAYLFDRVKELSKDKQHPVTFNPGTVPIILSKRISPSGREE
jgi:WD40 repeat protein